VLGGQGNEVHTPLRLIQQPLLWEHNGGGGALGHHPRRKPNGSQQQSQQLSQHAKIERK
jgi:hypothetical protein